jgi:hypothetical protein
MFDLGRTRDPMFPGKTISLSNGANVTLSGWNISTAREGCDAREVIRRAQRGEISNDSPAAVDAYLRLTWLTIRMNYPDVTEEYIAEYLQLRDMRKIAVIIADLNQVDDAEGEAAAPTTGASTPLMNGTISQP